MRRVLLVLLLLVAYPAAAERWELLYLEDTGLTLGSVTVDYTTDGAADTLPGGVTLDEIGGGWYSVNGLPDVLAGSGTTHGLGIVYGPYALSYAWPRSAVTPTVTTTAPLSITVPSGQRAVELGQGATLPHPLVVVSGVSADPTGATATAILAKSGAAPVTLSGSSVVEDVEALSDGTWRFRVRYQWVTADTASLSGTYSLRFSVTFAGGEVLIAPPAPQVVTVTVYP